jgi:hypothetical protein
MAELVPSKASFFSQRQKLLSSPWGKAGLVLLGFTLIFFLYHSFYAFYIGDDEWIINSGVTFEDYTVDNYWTWSSRYLYNALGFGLVHHFKLWIFMDIGVSLIGVLLIGSLLPFGERWQRYLLGGGCYMLIPLLFNYEAGWVMTSVNYGWAFLGLGAFILALEKARRGDRMRVVYWLLGILGALYSAFNEVASVVLLLASILYGVILYRHKGTWGYALAGILIGLGGLLNALLCPGEAKRLINETKTWFPEFATLSLGGKIVEGIAFLNGSLFWFLPLGNMFHASPLAFDLFIVLLLAYGHVAKKSQCGQIFALISLLGSLGLQAACHGAYRFPPQLPWGDAIFILFQSGACLTLLSLGVAFFLLTHGERNFSFSLGLILLLALGSKAAMGLSPTVYDSGFRTGYFMILGFIVNDILLLQKIRNLDFRFGMILAWFVAGSGFLLFALSFDTWYQVDPSVLRTLFH